MYLTIYDVTGIQEFIFRSNRLKENVGASKLVEKMTTDFLYQALQEILGNGANISWETSDTFQMAYDPKLKAEVIYSGGGNALVAYRDRETAIEVTKRHSEIILEKTATCPMVAVTERADGNRFWDDLRNLVVSLHRKKREFSHTYPLSGLAITELCPETDLPVSMYDLEQKRYVPNEMCFKRREAQFHEVGLDEYPGYCEPLDFNDLGRGDGESYIAVVHIDGNSFGKMFFRSLEKCADYQQAVHQARTMSKKIRDTYRKTYKDMAEFVIKRIRGGKIDRISLKQDKETGKWYLPFRRIVLNGDEVTFVCDGRLALSMTKFFLENLSQNIIPEPSEEGEEAGYFSACAGIAIVKTRFPFYRAYQIAEQCLSSAKQKAKYFADRNSGRIKCYLDFHLVREGITTSLNEIRSRYYRYSGDEKGANFDLPFYHLLWRPWLVGKTEFPLEEDHHFNRFVEIYRHFAQKWPRHRLKQLLKKLSISRAEAEWLWEELKSRGLTLKELKGGDVLLDGELFTKEGNTPYYDVLEMMDLFIHLDDSLEGVQAEARMEEEETHED